MKKIYLAGPLRDCDDNETTTWRTKCKEHLASYFLLLDPMRNKYDEGDIMARNEIIVMDKKDIVDSDIILANCWKASVGTSIEIFFAHQQHKVVVVIGKEEDLSPWIYYHATKILPDVESAIKYIKEKLL